MPGIHTYRQLALVAQVTAGRVVAGAIGDAEEDEGGGRGEARSGEQAAAPRKHGPLGAGSLLLLHDGQLQDVRWWACCRLGRKGSVPNGSISRLHGWIGLWGGV